MPYEMKARGERYIVHANGNIQRTDMEFTPSGKWKLQGLRPKWNANRTSSFSELKKRMNKGETVEGYVIDLDHGTTRMWAGRYNGHIPKATIHKIPPRRKQK
jgi:hypothetical protein